MYRVDTLSGVHTHAAAGTGMYTEVLRFSLRFLRQTPSVLLEHICGCRSCSSFPVHRSYSRFTFLPVPS